MKAFKILIATYLVLLMGCKPAGKYPVVELHTKFGDIQIELYNDKAPQTVAAFLKNVEAGVYKDCYFYRVLNQDNQSSDAVKAYLIQGGIWRNNSRLSDSLPKIPHETTQQSGILHTDGVISMARLAPGTAGTEFFICTANQPGLDYGGRNNSDGQGYAAFGKVLDGMDVVRKIYNQPEDDQSFDPPVKIYEIVRLQ